MRGNFITDRKGILNPNYKDGRKGTRLYKIYNNMKSRCYNANCEAFKYYGARGITIYEPWLQDFKVFKKWAHLNGYNDHLQIDRIDVNGNYTPQNCRWVTSKIQSVNRRVNHYLTIDGERKALSTWAEIYSINYRTLRDRLKRGWPVSIALSLPVETKFRRKVVRS